MSTVLAEVEPWPLECSSPHPPYIHSGTKPLFEDPSFPSSFSFLFSFRHQSNLKVSPTSLQLLATAAVMAPIPTIDSAFNTRSILDPAVNEISTLLHRLGIVHDHPDFGDGDIPGEGGPDGGIGDGGLIGSPTDAQRSGILMVLMMFGIMAVMFTIVTGWIWCVAAREPAYYTVREGRKGQCKTKKVVPFKGNY